MNFQSVLSKYQHRSYQFYSTAVSYNQSARLSSFNTGSQGNTFPQNLTSQPSLLSIVPIFEPLHISNERDHLVRSLITNTKAALSISFEGWDNDRNYLPCKLLELRAHIFLAHKRAFWRKQDKLLLL